MRDTLDFHIRLHRQLLDRDAGTTLGVVDLVSFNVHRTENVCLCKMENPTYRLRLVPKSIINAIHRRKIRHVGQENIDLDDIFQRRTSLFQDRGKILESLCLMRILVLFMFNYHGVY